MPTQLIIGERKEIPDLAIEVVLSSGVVDKLAVDKLAIYEGLGVAEIWVREAQKFTLYHLRPDGYEQITASELLPECDINLLAQHIQPQDQFDAIMDYRDQLRQQS